MLVMLLAGVIISCKEEAQNENSSAVQSGNETNQQINDETVNDETVKVNPAHGQPGHRCDLPVGAPLNGEANTTTTQPQTTQLPSTSVSPVRVDQTPEVNPPHGEPGHDCSVPVGAKLEN